MTMINLQIIDVTSLTGFPAFISLSQEQQAQANISNICTGLDILCFLLTMLPSPAILAHFKPLQRGIAACMTCGNTKVLRAVHSLLSRLMSNFPTEPSKLLLLNVLKRSRKFCTLDLSKE